MFLCIHRKYICYWECRFFLLRLPIAGLTKIDTVLFSSVLILDCVFFSNGWINHIRGQGKSIRYVSSNLDPKYRTWNSRFPP